MAERSSKKQKTGIRSAKPQTEERIADPRFANIQSDPRYRLPGKKNKVKLDKRFSRALQDEDFTRRAKVDRYGRPLESDAERKRLKRKYEFEEDEEDSDEPDADDDVQKELNKFEKPFDPLRDTRDDESVSDETTSDEESEEEEADLEDEVGIGAAEQTDVPTGEVTSRIAIVNLDWDNIRAADLMAVFNSFLPSTGSLLKVAIYPSEFGRERLEREELEGPPKEIFANDAKTENEEESEEDDDEEDIKKSILQPDDGADFDSAALRKYQLERLRYYYCILTFSSPDVAKHIYDAVDGTEYLRTANFFDLRFVPDDTDFSTDMPKEECERLPDDYKPNNFVTDALQHSKVKLTWDAEDGSRKQAVERAFKGGRKEIDENDVKAYLGSDTSDDEDEENANAPVSKKEEERQRMRSLLGLAPEPAKKSKKEKAPVGDMQVTFTSGLAAEKDGKKKRSVFENSPEPDETTVEKYIRKERERKLKRKERKVVSEDQDDAEQEQEPQDTVDNDNDLGFNDPFFAGGHDESDEAVEPSAKAERAASNKMRKEERLKKKAERQAEEEIERKQRAELELLMADDNDATGVRHFDMKEIERAEKQARKKGKKGKYDKKKAATEEVGDDFTVDTADPRFARLFESHEFAIDPTNPRFKGTKAMKTLLEEGRRRKHGADREEEPSANGKGKDKDDSARTVKGGDGDVKSLVEKIKRQTKK
ncbi:hypothetical protein PV11_03322 [Exophiala sideris]|uniref:Uncharacterized protein n=1 Tax=Exophiala sideris TaxID=1016849 RepID=A0A0D1WG99_9EURO|nr:hypothetical protein PV11_03322 [Exophiala sideris]